VTRPGARPGPADVGGPLVALCVGHRCSALRRLAGTADTLDVLTDAVRGTPGGVLVTTACPGACALSSVAAVAHRSAGSRSPGATLWLSGIQVPDRAGRLAAWVADGGPGSAERPDRGLPACLRDAVAGYGPPARVAPGPRAGAATTGDRQRRPGQR
jgi:hypothetical protein